MDISKILENSDISYITIINRNSKNIEQKEQVIAYYMNLGYTKLNLDSAPNKNSITINIKEKKFWEYCVCSDDYNRTSKFNEYIIDADDIEIVYPFLNNFKYVELNRMIDGSVEAKDLLAIDKLVDSGKLVLDKSINNGTYARYLEFDESQATLKFVNLRSSENVITLDEVQKIQDNWLDIDYFRHEALHVSNLYMENVYEHLVEHHYYHQEVNPTFNKFIDMAVDALWNAYQSANEETEVKKYIANIWTSSGQRSRNV